MLKTEVIQKRGTQNEAEAEFETIRVNLASRNRLRIPESRVKKMSILASRKTYWVPSVLSTLLKKILNYYCSHLFSQKVEVNFGIDMGSECDESPPASQPTTPNADNLNASMDSAQLTRRISTLSNTGVKLSMQKWSPGFQPELFCQQIANEPVPMITCMTLSSAYGL